MRPAEVVVGAGNEAQRVRRNGVGHARRILHRHHLQAKEKREAHACVSNACRRALTDATAARAYVVVGAVAGEHGRARRDAVHWASGAPRPHARVDISCGPRVPFALWPARTKGDVGVGKRIQVRLRHHHRPRLAARRKVPHKGALPRPRRVQHESHLRCKPTQRRSRPPACPRAHHGARLLQLLRLVLLRPVRHQVAGRNVDHKAQLGMRRRVLERRPSACGCGALGAEARGG